MSTDKLRAREKRHRRIRFKLKGSSERPRLSVYRSLSNIYAQIIDDSKGMTLASASTIDKGLTIPADAKGKTAEAAVIGQLIAEKAKAAGVTKVVFDRGGFKYHGRIKALSDSARKAGLDF